MTIRIAPGNAYVSRSSLPNVVPNRAASQIEEYLNVDRTVASTIINWDTEKNIPAANNCPNWVIFIHCQPKGSINNPAIMVSTLV